MAPQSEAAAEALRPALRFIDDVDEDMFESIADMVAEAVDENGKASTSELAAILEETLEPFLLALGAEPTAIPGCAMQVAVGLRGMEDVAPAGVAVAAPVVKTKEEVLEVLPSKSASVKAVPKAEVRKGVDNGGGKTGGYPGGPTLADLCSTGGGFKKNAGREPDAAKSDAPLSLGAIWSTQVDAQGEAQKVWKSLGADGPGAPDPLSDPPSEDEDALGGAPKEPGAAERKRAETAARKASQRAERLARSAALGMQAPEQDLDDIAAHGLRETQQSLETGSGPGKKAHKEGKGSRVVHLEDVSLTVAGVAGEPSRNLLWETSLHLEPGHVYGLVGKNGSGKTTLLRRLATKALPGVPQHLKFGYVAQELAALPEKTSVLEAVLGADEEMRELLRERREIDEAMAGSEDLQGDALVLAEKRAQRFMEVEERLEAMDADGAETRATEALSRLSFDEAMMKKPASELSGGWRMRLALAAALCRQPDVLLLDEPTNHLDLHGVLWLQQHLRREWGAEAAKKNKIAVLVSHDRAFLDGCVTDILEVNDCKLRNFPGMYSDYVHHVADEQRIFALKRDEAERQEKLAKKDIQAMKKKAREHHDDKKVAQLKSKEKKLEQGLAVQREGGRVKLSSQRAPGSIEDLVAKLREDTSLRFRFPSVEHVTDADLLQIDSAAIRQGSTTILRKVTLTLDSTSRIAVVGANGAGKSTLMRALAGELKAEEGPRGRGRTHAAYQPGFASQNHLEKQSQSLHGNCIDYLRPQLPDEDDGVVRAQLGNFGLGNDALKKVGYLSGGQKARLSFAAMTAVNPNVLLLDEPTNHLDLDSLDALTLGLQSFEGAVIVVSHNQGFLEALCDELWIVEAGSVRVCPKGEEAFGQFFAEYAKSVRATFR